MSKEIKLGQFVRDVVTGFEGVTTARVEYISGCVQYCVQPTIVGEGNLPKHEYIDVQRLEALRDAVDVALFK